METWPTARARGRRFQQTSGTIIRAVRKGEYLAKIARANGLGDWRVIYDHPNNAAFKKKRPNPDVIMAGDVLFIPEPPEPTVFTCQTGQSHVFVLQSSLYVCVQIRDGDGPLASANYVLNIGKTKLKGQSDSNGIVKQSVPLGTRWAVLDLPERNLTWRLEVGGLDPLAETTGVAQRLANLGFLKGGTNHDPDEVAAALHRFQVANEIPVSGVACSRTLQKLCELHDGGVQS